MNTSGTRVAMTTWCSFRFNRQPWMQFDASPAEASLISISELTTAVKRALERELATLHPYQTTLGELDFDSLDFAVVSALLAHLAPGVVLPTANGLVDPSWTIGEIHHLLCAWEERPQS